MTHEVATEAPSATYIGIIGGVMLAVPIVMSIAADLSTIHLQVNLFRRNINLGRFGSHNMVHPVT